MRFLSFWVRSIVGDIYERTKKDKKSSKDGASPYEMNPKLRLEEEAGKKLEPKGRF